MRKAERDAGVLDTALTPALSWSAYSLGKAWNEAKAEAAPWWAEVSMHAFRSGTTAVAAALKNFSDSKKGARKGRPAHFPRPKSRRRSTPSVSFVEINHQLSWLCPSRHGVRLMLPQSSPAPDIRRRRAQLVRIHTNESTRRLYNLVDSGRSSIQKVTISHRGGRWQAAFSVRHTVVPAGQAQRRGATERTVGLDAGLRHLATLSTQVPGPTDADGHIANPAVLTKHLAQLKKLDRAIARRQRGSKNRAKLCGRRARLHGRIARTRSLELHRVTNELVGRFGVIGIEDLHVAGIGARRGRLGRSVADASLGEFRHQLAYKCADAGVTLICVDRFYPSSKTCSSCGTVKAKLDRAARVFECEECGISVDRDVGAARNIAREVSQLLEQQRDGTVAGLRPKTQNADPRLRKTGRAEISSATSPAAAA